MIVVQRYYQCSFRGDLIICCNNSAVVVRRNYRSSWHEGKMRVLLTRSSVGEDSSGTRVVWNRWYLVGGLVAINFIFPYIGLRLSSQLTNSIIFQDGVALAHQRNRWYLLVCWFLGPSIGISVAGWRNLANLAGLLRGEPFQRAPGGADNSWQLVSSCYD